MNAKQAAERKYKATLQKAGLNEDFVRSKSSKAGSSSAALEDYDDEEEVSYMFGSRHDSKPHSPTPRSASHSAKSYSDDFDDQAGSFSRSRGHSDAEARTDAEEDIVEDLDDI